MLTPHQQEKKDEVLSAIRSGQKRVILQGAAGVGKTVLASNIVESLSRDYSINQSYNNGVIYITAPTNKALSVLQNKINARSNYQFKTIHSALKLKLVTNEKTGDRKFIPAFSRGDKDREFKDCRACIVDESSMVNSEILHYLRDYHFPIIFVGDSFQINPVGELETPVFNRNYPVFELTEIIRQGAGNPIIDLSRDLDMIYFKQPNMIDGKGYVYDNNVDSLIDQLAEVNGSDEMKYLAWTNLQIDAINSLVRERIYGKPKKVEKDEIIVFDAPLEGYYTNQEVKVQDLDVVTMGIPVPKHSTKFDYTGQPINNTDFIRMKFYRVNNSFNVVHEDSESLFKQVCSSLKENAKKYGWSWLGYYYFYELFAAFKYNHAISVHKSQGSTYKTAIINIGNIDFNKNAEEKQRLLYTAVTRASDLVILNNVR